MDYLGSRWYNEYYCKETFDLSGKKEKKILTLRLIFDGIKKEESEIVQQ